MPSPERSGFIESICMEHAKLVSRHRQLQPKRRIRILARPKFITLQFNPTHVRTSPRKTQIIRDMPIITRTEQLAYPYVRRLLSNQRDFATVLDPTHQRVLNRTIRKSFLSLYSRLANLQAPKEKEIIAGWTKKDWARHRKYLRKLATPRKVKPHRWVREWKDIKLMKRYKKLCKPKKRVEQVMPQWELTSALKTYTPTERIVNLSRPKERDESINFQSLGTRVSQKALHYKPTERIKQLATPPEVRLGESDLKENPFGISPNALKAKTSDRITELSQPKETKESHTRENPFMISPSALKAKSSARIIQLSQPKGSA